MSNVTNIEDGREFNGEWSIICVNPYDFAMELAIGPFENSEEAVEFALVEPRCEKDWQWTVIPSEFPHSKTETDKIQPDRSAGLEKGTDSVPFDNPEKED